MIRPKARRKRSSPKAQEPNVWLLHGLVILAVMRGVSIVIFVEVRPLPLALKDFGLILGGGLIGFISVSFEEIVRAAPERRRAREQRAKDLAAGKFQREEEGRQHEKELEESHQKFLALESELSVSMRRGAELQAPLELVGAHERSRIYCALLLGYFYDRRETQLGSLPPTFSMMALKLELPADELLKKEDLVEFLGCITDALEVKCGPVVRGAFELGCLLRDLDKNGFGTMHHPEALESLQSGLKLLKCDPEILRRRQVLGGMRSCRENTGRGIIFFRNPPEARLGALPRNRENVR